MASKFYKFRGKMKWNQNITTPDEFRGSEFYKVSLYDLDEQSLKDFEESGIQSKPKQDNDGDTLYTFRRPVQKIIQKKLAEFGPPEFVKEDGSPVDVMVAHGSEAEIEVVVYDTMMGKGCRLNKVTVTNLIEFTPEEPDVNEEEIDKSAFA